MGLTKHQEGWKKAEEGLTQSRDPVFNYILVTFQLHVIHFPMYIIMFLDKQNITWRYNNLALDLI